MTSVRNRDRMVQALLNSARPLEVRGDTIILACEAPLHRDKLSEDKRRDLVERVFTEVLGTPCHIQCVVDSAPPAARAAVPEAPPPSDLFAAAPPRSEEPRGDLYEGQPPNKGGHQDEREEIRQSLLRHPAVQALQKRGGQVTEVSLFDEDQEETKRGQ
jgi:hypothetical protein